MQTRMKTQIIKYKAVTTVIMLNWYCGSLEKGNFMGISDVFRKALALHCIG